MCRRRCKNLRIVLREMSHCFSFRIDENLQLCIACSSSFRLSNDRKTNVYASSVLSSDRRISFNSGPE